MHPRPDQQPAPGRIVLACTDAGLIVPAVIVATPESQRTYPTTDEPALELDPDRIHLVTFSASASAQGLGGTYPMRHVLEDEHVGGYYRPDHTRGTWRWPHLR
jgi:hypothetical protein